MAKTILSLCKLVLSVAVVSLVLTFCLWQAHPQTVKNHAKLKEAVAAYKAGDYVTALKVWLPLPQMGNDNAPFFAGGLYPKV
tara:strand:- start:912 stop:1157 length:246 start_codon:yes stop_codon:yes gene_type:complete